jgi:hypothetical protein
VSGQVLGNVSCVQFGSAADVGAVSLHHDGELHDPSEVPVGPPFAIGIAAGAAGA